MYGFEALWFNIKDGYLGTHPQADMFCLCIMPASLLNSVFTPPFRDRLTQHVGSCVV